MSLTDQIAIDTLRRFDRLEALDEDQLSRFAARAELKSAARGSCLFELGSTDGRQLLLLDGELELQAGDGAVHRVRHTDTAAKGPVSRLRPSRYRVTAWSDVRYVLVDPQVLEEHLTAPSVASMVVEESYLASEPNGLLDDAAHPLMFDLLHDLNHGRILVPSDREVAVRVGRTLDPFEPDLNRMARTLAVCPALTLKMLRSAEAEAGDAPVVRSTRAAVERLGAERVFALSVNCVLRESLRSDVVAVRGQMRAWWETSMRVAAVSGVLAADRERFDPAYARLIGLLYNIAEPVMLGYADRHPDLHDDKALERLVRRSRGELGRIMLTMWALPRELVAAASHCNDWGYEHAGEADYTDIMLAAQWHVLRAGPQRRRIPPAAEVPALHRLGLERPSAEAQAKIDSAIERALIDIDTLLQA